MSSQYLYTMPAKNDYARGIVNRSWARVMFLASKSHRRTRYAGFRLTCRLPHCRFGDDICSTAQAPLAAEG